MPYTLLSFISAIVYWLLEIGFLGEDATYPFSESAYSATNAFIGLTFMSTILGTAIGLVEETIFKTKFRSVSFVSKIALKALVYVTFLLLLLFMLSLVLNAVNLEKSLFHKEVVNNVLIFFSNFTLLGTVVYISFMIILGLIFSEIIDYLGMDVVGSFFTGKYNKSLVEERIFMFLDMKDSTAIAERLGHKKHYQFINEYYGDMTQAILKTKGEIYQYAGDEIIISWALPKGLHNSNCLNCFFLIQNAIKAKKEGYKKKFGVYPKFRAGLHYGKVTRGQVGFIKKELLFTGDVLNTTSRIQAQCKTLNTDLLISNTLRKLMDSSGFEFIDKGSFALRGRKEEERLVEIKILGSHRNHN